MLCGYRLLLCMHKTIKHQTKYCNHFCECYSNNSYLDLQIDPWKFDLVQCDQHVLQLYLYYKEDRLVSEQLRSQIRLNPHTSLNLVNELRKYLKVFGDRYVFSDGRFNPISGS